ncbi:hypothetical protein D3C87_460020 [compost metagenome]
MTMRSYSGLLVLEDIFEYIPTENPDIANLANMVFTPNVPIVMNDCGTTLGNFATVNYELEGKVELATGDVISKDRIDQLLFHGTYEIATRDLHTCIAKDGVCQQCYHAANQRNDAPAIGSRVVIQPEYVVATDVIKALAGESSWDVSLADNTYQFTYVYLNGTLLDTNQYTVVNQVLTLNTPLSSDMNVVIHFTDYNKASYLVYLAKTYSGSMLGMKPLPAPLLPIRSLLISSLIPDNKLELIVEYTKEVNKIPDDYKSYLDTIADKFEKTLYTLAINCIYANVTV